MTRVLKVIVKDGEEDNFKLYCNKRKIVHKQYSLEILKTRFRVECSEKELNNAKSIIESVCDMPKATIDNISRKR